MTIHFRDRVSEDDTISSARLDITRYPLLGKPVGFDTIINACMIFILFSLFHFLFSVLDPKDLENRNLNHYTVEIRLK